MARVNATEVRDVIYLPSTFLDGMVDQCITTANIVVDSNLLDSELSDDLLKQIELYLSAHFCSVREPQLTEEEIGGRDSTVKEKRRLAMIGFGFASTAFGQQAIAIDPTGKLAELSKQNKKRASLSAHGPYDSTYVPE